MTSGVWGGRGGGRSAWVYLDVEDPFVAWMVYRGELISADQVGDGAISIFHTRRLKHARRVLYDTETALDDLRAELRPEAPSRLRGFFAFPDSESARRAAALWPLPAFREENLVEVEVHPDASISEHDSQFITRKLASGPGPWMKQYVLGDTDEQGPWGYMPELVIEGRALILGTETRERAKQTVLATWPRTDSLLELGRIGVQLGTDVGLITAWVEPSAQRRVRFIMRDGEYRDPAFIARLAEFRDAGNPIDWDALATFQEDRAVVPDLRAEEFDLDG